MSRSRTAVDVALIACVAGLSTVVLVQRGAQERCVCAGVDALAELAAVDHAAAEVEAANAAS